MSSSSSDDTRTAGRTAYHRQVTVAQRAHVGRRDLIRIFGEDRLVAVIRTPSAALARESARAISEAGVRLIEITMTVPDALEVIEELAADASFSARGAIVGAGTVLNGRQADAALLAGAMKRSTSPSIYGRSSRARDSLSPRSSFPRWSRRRARTTR